MRETLDAAYQIFRARAKELHKPVLRENPFFRSEPLKQFLTIIEKAADMIPFNQSSAFRTEISDRILNDVPTRRVKKSFMVVTRAL
ncbi:MAG: hypothetical protein M2R45_03142 [Verrucomicrobia subdivision 3 bacterium]|nr:hypothetical protein [Limisphaerales bacterium]MCS1413210.1 hypothetical protein [Limisphaerales bacterium]